MSNFALSQILAGVAFAFGLASVQFKTRHHILLCLFVSTAFNGVHFLLLDLPGPGALMFLIGIRYLVATQTTNRKALIFFLVLTCGTFWVTAKTPVSLLALCGALMGTFGSFHPQGRAVRLYFMGGNISWLSHNILAWTPVGIVMEIAFLASSTVGFWRHYGSPFKCRTAEELSNETSVGSEGGSR
jgi:hypothetical protein